MKQNDIINYEELVQTAIRKVMRDVLTDVAKNGLPGKHHFYIDFITNYPGVQIPDFLREDYPEDMTIVLQHEYWDLEIHDKLFAVTLSFDNADERIIVPFDAVIKFVDPSVNFGLEFTPSLDSYEELDLSILLEPEKKEIKPLAEGETNVVTLDAFRKK
ncbi:MAG: ClpXP protease specificity-enhancing factor SspB [Pseudomonadota bacterium]|nr:ClpXP protease specificity-enhancing factor SspB [Alphaproteobacteria bacterium]MDP5370122.1 ClpXP protease specificity-enhancing factor SspB [Pseudomonadota bacterium]